MSRAGQLLKEIGEGIRNGTLEPGRVYGQSPIAGIEFTDAELKNAKLPPLTALGLTVKQMATLVNAIINSTDEDDPLVVYAPDIVAQIAFEALMCSDKKKGIFHDCKLYDADWGHDTEDTTMSVLLKQILSGEKQGSDSKTTEGDTSSKTDETGTLSERLAAKVNAVFSTTSKSTEGPFNINGEPSKLKVVLGAYCFSFLRILSKDQENFKKFITAPTANTNGMNKFQSQVKSVYDVIDIQLTQGAALKIPSPAVLNRFVQSYNSDSSRGATLALWSTKLLSDPNQLGIVTTPLRSFAMITLEYYGLSLFYWFKKCSEVMKMPALELIEASYNFRTAKSLKELSKFIVKYEMPAEDTTHMAEYLGVTPVGGIYWKIARTINKKYLANMGRAGNQDAIGFFMSLAYLASRNTNDRFSSDTLKRIIPKGCSYPQEKMLVDAMMVLMSHEKAVATKQDAACIS